MITLPPLMIKLAGRILLLTSVRARCLPERQIMVDVNDFDETLPSPGEWDVKRLAAGLEIAGRDCGFAPAERRAMALAMAEEYETRMKQCHALQQCI
jgi:uncharacterized protein (DUF2252 family)